MSPDGCDPDKRRSGARSNMFVVAALSSATASGPVRIRNMSRSGALVEGACIPAEGSPIRLCRGSLTVSGLVMWRKGARAGVRFDTAVAVEEWLPRGNSVTRQQQIDEVVHRFKTGSSDSPIETAVHAVGVASDGASALRRIRQALNAAAEDLASEAGVRDRHLRALQAIDMAAQQLEGLESRLVTARGIAL